MKRALQIGFALGVSCFFIWLSLRGRDLHEIGAAIASANYWWVAAYVVCLMIVHLIRVIRWGILLEPIAKVSLRDLNMLGAVGFMLLMIVPLRLGELGRPLLVARHLRVSRSASMASVVFERIVDAITMGLVLVMLAWALPRTGSDAAFVRNGAALVTVGFSGLLVVLIFAVRLPAQTEAVIRHTIGRFMPKMAERVIAMLQAFTGGLRVLPSVGKAIEFFSLTAFYWWVTGTSLIVLGWAFPGLRMSLVCAFTVLGLQVIGAMIPGGPGGVGTYQWVTTLGLGLFIGHSPAAQTLAAAYANTVWACQFGQQVIYGLIFVLIGHIDLHGLIGLGSELPGPGGDDRGGDVGASTKRPRDSSGDRERTAAVPSALP
jgi:uncharacterized protein (TIRG00374 family)